MSTGQMVGQASSAEIVSLTQGSASAAATSAASASADAQTSLSASSDATASASVALAAELGAVAARDAAQSVSGIYADTTAGLAATASGGYFYVPAGISQPDVLILYLDSAGVAVEVGRVASSAAVQALELRVPANPGAGTDLDAAVDSIGNVYRRTTADGGLVLAGRTTSVQAKLAELDAVTVQAATVQDVAADAAGNVLRYFDAAGGFRLPGRDESVQASLRRIEEEADLLYRPSKNVSLPATFTPMTRALRPEERFVWAGMPAQLRPNQTTITCYPFEWVSQDLVIPSMMRRRQGTINPPGAFDPVTWGAEETLTVNAPAGFFDNVDPLLRRQWRDASVMYDRKLGKYWWADSGITNTASGWQQINIPIFESTDGLTWDFVCYTPNWTIAPAGKIITPDWFVDSDGEVYLIGDGYHNGATAERGYHILHCTDPDTMTTWDMDFGELTGTAFPTLVSTGVRQMIDPFLFQRHGIYYVIWKAESTDPLGTEQFTQLGIAWSTSLLGPYNNGHRFLDPYGTRIKGEGQSVHELPPGGPYRYRLCWDNYGMQSYTGIGANVAQLCADTNDFTTFSPVKHMGLGATYRRHCTFVVGF